MRNRKVEGEKRGKRNRRKRKKYGNFPKIKYNLCSWSKIIFVQKMLYV
jgi:hypothetical protein